MADYLGLILENEDFSTKELTLRSLTSKYGVLENCNKDIATIEKEISKLISLKEEYVKIKQDIENKINCLSNTESKIIIKIKEHLKSDKYDYYSLKLQVLKVSLDNTLIIDILDNREFSFVERGKIFEKHLNDSIENCLNESIEKYPEIEIYSNKVLKNNRNYLPLDLLNNLK